MKRVKLIVAYDGTNYHGWQTQPNAVTIEEVLNHHLSELLKEEIKVIGASRTDAGDMLWETWLFLIPVHVCLPTRFLMH